MLTIDTKNIKLYNVILKLVKSSYVSTNKIKRYKEYYMIDDSWGMYLHIYKIKVLSINRSAVASITFREVLSKKVDTFGMDERSYYAKYWWLLEIK